MSRVRDACEAVGRFLLSAGVLVAVLGSFMGLFLNWLGFERLGEILLYVGVGAFVALIAVLGFFLVIGVIMITGFAINCAFALFDYAYDPKLADETARRLSIYWLITWTAMLCLCGALGESPWGWIAIGFALASVICAIYCGARGIR